MLGQNETSDRVETIVGLRNLIPDDHVLKRLDSKLRTGWVRELVREKYTENFGRPSVDPEAIFRLMIVGSLYGITSDRALMRRAQTDIAIRWFAGYALGDSLPDHSSLTRTRQRWGVEIFAQMFKRVVAICTEAGLVDGATIHIDATMVRANASVKSLVDDYVVKSMHENSDNETNSKSEEFESDSHTNQSNSSPPAKEHAEKQPEKRRRGKPTHRGRARNVSKKQRRSRTDSNAVMSRSSRSEKFMPCYKSHLAVDDRCGIVVDITVTEGNVGEGTQILEQLERSESTTGIKVERVTADTGYGSAANFKELESMGIDPVIPPRPQRQGGKKYSAKRFKYDEFHDHVVCPNGKKLRPKGYVDEGRKYTASAADCRRCPLKEFCVHDSACVRTVYISDGHPSLLRARRRRNRWDEECAEIYTRHKWMVEGRNSEIKHVHGLSRMSRRGIDNAMIQALLGAIAMNSKRLAATLLQCYWRHVGAFLRAEFAV